MARPSGAQDKESLIPRWKALTMLATRQRKPSGNGSRTVTKTPRIEYVAPGPAVIVCKMEDGAFYELPLAVLKKFEAWDNSGLAACDLIDHGYAFVVVLRSGARLEIPSDLVLHHCEPAYAFHVSKTGPMRIGARVRALRTERGFTLEDLSKRSGLAIPNLCNLEHDKHVPTWQTLTKVAKALGVAPLRLLA